MDMGNGKAKLYWHCNACGYEATGWQAVYDDGWEQEALL